MSAEELTLVRNTQAKISRRLKLEQLIQLEHSQAVERAWILTLLKSLEELELDLVAGELYRASCGGLYRALQNNGESC